MSMMSQTYRRLPALALGTLIALPALAASEEDTVAAKLEEFRSAQMAANAATLTALTVPELSYSHSDTRVEDRATFVANTTSGKKPFLALEYREPTIRVVGNNAIVRFHWVGEQQAVADGKKIPTDLRILMVWQKQGSEWKLLARSATKL